MSNEHYTVMHQWLAKANELGYKIETQVPNDGQLTSLYYAKKELKAPDTLNNTPGIYETKGVWNLLGGMGYLEVPEVQLMVPEKLKEKKNNDSLRTQESGAAPARGSGTRPV